MFRARGSVQAIATSAVLAVGLGGAAFALAAHPKEGRRYSGFTSEPKLAGFGARVSFKVAVDGQSLRSFTYSSIGCFGGGGSRPGVDVFTEPSAIHRLGSIAVSATGAFSAAQLKSSYSSQGTTTLTTTKVTGSFKTAKKATGTIRFTQTMDGPHLTTNRCGPAEVTFRVTAK